MSAPFSAFLTESGVRFEQAAQVAAHVRGRFEAGEIFLVTFHDYSQLRSLLQNGYLHAEPIRKFALYTGNTPAQQKLDLLGEYFGWTMLKSGHLVPVKPSTSELTTREFAEWVDWLIQFGTENGLNILPPEKDPAKRDPRLFVEQPQ